MASLNTHLAVAALTLTAILGTSALAQTHVTDMEIRNSYHEKAAIAQLLRWYQFYENTEVGLDNQRDILTEDFSVTSPSGTAEGRDQYEIAVQRFPADWQNAHQLHDFDVTVNDDGTLGLTAEITYSNVGAANDNAVSAKRIGYVATMEYGDELLPRFKDMAITPVRTEEVADFTDTYIQNRLTSLVNYWILLVEHPGRDAEPFREILAPELDIRFSAEGDTYTRFEQIAAWVAGPVSSLPATRHVILPLTYMELGTNRYEINIGFDWQGIRPDGARMTAKTNHKWIVVDDPSERFARVENIRVEQIEPFTIVD